MKNHNKKRNAGLLYEFLVKDLSRALVEDDSKRSQQTLKIIKKHFKTTSALYKEWRLINSLIKTTVTSDAVASSILTEAKAAARKHDVKALEREKSLIIKDINHKLNDQVFFDQQINEYKMYATVQSMINGWRSDNVDLGKLAQYEDQVVEYLKMKKQENDVVINEDPATSRLLLRVMTTKLNEKYGEVLTPLQRQIVKAYVYSTTKSDPKIIQQKLTEVRDSLLSSIKLHVSNSQPSQKLLDVQEKLINENVDVVDDESIVRFMLYVNLNDELLKGNHE